MLFIHGINGSPRDFRYLIARLNRAHFQAWVFRYRSGAGLRDVTVQLRDAINGIESRYSVSSLIIVAHSMGGLIARDLLLSRGPEALPEVPLLITLSTPWEGHKGAAFGARFALTPPPSWRDMAPGSAYLSELFGDAPGAERTLPEGTQHHLFFSYRKSRVSFGESSDEVVSLASQLRGPAQEQASRLYGFDATHLGILSDAAAAAAMNRLLDATRVSSAVAALRR